jgi:hypothetical protein
VRDDPDAVLKLISGTWYGFPDFSTDFRRISEPQFQPPPELLVTYQELSEVIDHQASKLSDPYPLALLHGTLPPLAGAAGLTFVPNVGPLSQFSGDLIVALAGDRAPFATSGRKLKAPTGYRVVRLSGGPRFMDVTVSDFVRNTAGKPRSRLGLTDHHISLERPVAVRFDPADGSMYLIDFGVLEMRKGREFIKERTGRVFKLVPQTAPSTQPASQTALNPLETR